MSEEKFKVGEKVPRTGVYYCRIDEKTFLKLNITEGSEFPDCDKCEDKEVVWLTKKIIDKNDQKKQ